MKNMTQNVLIVFISVAWGACCTADDSFEIPLVVQVIERVELPALETGVIQTLEVSEGDRVTSGEVLGSLDDRQTRLQAKLAASELAVAKEQSKSFTGIEAAERELAQQQQMAEQQRILRRIAERKSENDIGVQVAEKAAGAAENEFRRASNAKKKFSDSVSQAELDALRLAMEKSQLETQQANFQQELNKLASAGEEKASLLHILKVDQARVGLKQARSDAETAKLQSESKAFAAQLADLQIQRRKFVASIDGIVVQRHKQVGDWIKAGEPVLRIVNLKRLRGEGFVHLSIARKLRSAGQVILICEVGENDVQRTAKVTFVSPEVMVDGKVRVLVEFDNEREDVLPGTTVTLTRIVP